MQYPVIIQKNQHFLMLLLNSNVISRIYKANDCLRYEFLFIHVYIVLSISLIHKYFFISNYKNIIVTNSFKLWETKINFSFLYL